jgi:hypothetical protein
LEKDEKHNYLDSDEKPGSLFLERDEWPGLLYLERDEKPS